MFPVLPLLQVRHGQLTGPGSGASSDARATVAALARGGGEVVVVDLDGLQSNRPDLEFLKDVARRNQIWADLGSRDATDVVELFVAGASRVTARWSLVRSTGELEEIAEMAEPGAAYLGLEFREAFVANPRLPALGVADAVEYARKLELPIVVLDVSAAGHGRRAVPPLHSGERWYAAPQPREELQALQAEGWAGAIGLPPGA